MYSLKNIRMFNYSLNMRIHERIFVEKQKKLLDDLQKAIGKREKMIIALEIYTDINKNFCPFLVLFKSMWINFAATVYNKTIEVYIELIKGLYDEIIDKDLVNRFTKEIMQTITFLNLQKTNPLLININNQRIKQAYNNIYQFLRERMLNTIHNDLMANRFHPKNYNKWSSWGFEDMVVTDSTLAKLKKIL
jgi:hypothetical protein